MLAIKFAPEIRSLVFDGVGFLLFALLYALLYIGTRRDRVRARWVYLLAACCVGTAGAVHLLLALWKVKTDGPA